MSVYYVFHEGEKRIISELASSNIFVSITVFHRRYFYEIDTIASVYQFIILYDLLRVLVL
ncbi:hypothetical protein DRO66_03015 [Candidatus Bathyarchaeota archaeon]|nr:MAG: hypothetical protein DRO66_03015 [Candidatus Bathyarchaeota archaeon]